MQDELDIEATTNKAKAPRVATITMATAWVPVDPDGVDVTAGGPLFLGKDGANTPTLIDAEIFPSQAAAQQASSGLAPSNYYLPKPLTDFWPSKK